MNIVIILIIIGGAVVFLAVLGIAFLTISNKKKAQKLNKTLEEYKKQSKQEPTPSPVTISGEREKIDEKFLSSSPIIEDYQDPDLVEEKTGEDNSQDEPDIEWEDFKFIDEDEEKPQSKPVQQESKDDFEEFLDKYSYTRKVIDKNMLKKLNSLPPEVKNAILGNVFNKYE